MDSFNQRKKDVLSKEDKSSIGKWDEKISSLCDKINSLENYYTTSSCSGRVLFMVDQDKKAENLFVFVSHDKISFKELKDELGKLISITRSHPTRDPAHSSLTFPSRNRSPTQKGIKNIKFKFEPCILHIACKTLEDAEKIYEKGRVAGWKKSGIIETKKNFIVELNASEKLELPIIQNGKLLVDDNFLKIIVDESNNKFEKVWMKIKKLEEGI